MPSFTPQALHALTSLVVTRMGSNPEETQEVADHLVRANLSGHDSHGVGMLPAYVRLLQDGLLVPNQTSHTVLDAGALLVIDARRGFGQRMAADAVRRAIERARELGACVLALRNSSHVGRIGTYGELATRAGMAFTAFVNVADHPDAQAPWACAEPRLGTNPFCTAVPGAANDDGPGLLLDMATTTIAAGKARVAYNKGVPVPDGSLIDAAGLPTNDPAGFIADRTGALLSFGKHKGSGSLAVMCEIMAGAIGGGQRVDQPVQGGHPPIRCWRQSSTYRGSAIHRRSPKASRQPRRIYDRHAPPQDLTRYCCRANRNAATRSVARRSASRSMTPHGETFAMPRRNSASPTLNSIARSARIQPRANVQPHLARLRERACPGLDPGSPSEARRVRALLSCKERSDPRAPVIARSTATRQSRSNCALHRIPRSERQSVSTATVHGWVAEWFKAAVLKTANPKGFVGSNPTPSASSASHPEPPGAKLSYISMIY